ncbi:hypothetical protein RRF57_002534 [Xylaria bambusicola]|uniref:Uncharacterized protein n=1 Tax=Xylaria bambusicola TaxID=326684 RepID=A0AAN7UJ49_9PEZI
MIKDGPGAGRGKFQGGPTTAGSLIGHTLGMDVTPYDTNLREHISTKAGLVTECTCIAEE